MSLFVYNILIDWFPFQLCSNFANKNFFVLHSHEKFSFRFVELSLHFLRLFSINDHIQFAKIKYEFLKTDSFAFLNLADIDEVV